MTTSEQTADLLSAFAKARAKFKPVKKTKSAKAGTYSYDYADLSEILDATVPALSEAGLVISQATTLLDNQLILATRLFHTSGQWLEATYPLSLYTKPQEQGSAITYARRYTLGALLGISAESDDDAQTAQHAEPVKAAPLLPAQTAKTKPGNIRISAAQRKRLFAIADASGWEKPAIKDVIRAEAGVEHSDEIVLGSLKGQYDALIKIFQKGPEHYDTTALHPSSESIMSRHDGDVTF